MAIRPTQGRIFDMVRLGIQSNTAKLIRALEAPRPRARYFVTAPTYVSGEFDKNKLIYGAGITADAAASDAWSGTG